MTTLKPTRNRALIQLLERDLGEKRIVIPNNATGKPTNLATLLAVGELTGEHADLKESLKPNVTIVCNNYFGTEIEYKGMPRVKLLNVEDIQAVIN